MVDMRDAEHRGLSFFHRFKLSYKTENIWVNHNGRLIVQYNFDTMNKSGKDEKSMDFLARPGKVSSNDIPTCDERLDARPFRIRQSRPILAPPSAICPFNLQRCSSGTPPS
jgi:hypothetical protein